MNDLWNTNNIKRPGQYISCMKLYGVPLLPPVISDECRQEMQYYKLLAQEVEKHLLGIKEAILTKEKTIEKSTNLNNEINHIQTEDRNNNKTEAKQDFDNCFDSLDGNLTVIDKAIIAQPSSPKLVEDALCGQLLKHSRIPRSVSYIENDVPERDIDCLKRKSSDLIEALNLSSSVEFPKSIENKNSSSSLKTSVSDLPKLERQRSYIIDNPSPVLLEYLEIHSLNNGVDMLSISMSELSNSNIKVNKRRSWDLETAKVQWCSMATDLTKQQTVPALVNSRAKSSDRVRRSSIPANLCNSITLNDKVTPKKIIPTKVDDANKLRQQRPVKFVDRNLKLNKSKTTPFNKTTPSPPVTPAKIVKTTPSKPENASICIKELYEKIRSQQEYQMVALIEKQKKERQMLEEFFAEQNAIFFNQLHCISPKTTNNIQHTGNDKPLIAPVSLSQLLNSLEKNPTPDNASTLNSETSFNVVNKRNDTVNNKNKSKSSRISTRTRTNTPERNSSSSPTTPVVYDTLQPYALLTDRTDHTLADVESSFTIDDSSYVQIEHDTVSRKTPTREPQKLNSPIKRIPTPKHALRSAPVYNKPQIETERVARKLFSEHPPTAKEILAATTIVAYCKGYLVRRLMTTERVQSAVQTIRDALVCALQLHQDREGIKGADIDLHRRLIQQITAACYDLHDTFINSTPQERCAQIALDRDRKRMQTMKQIAQKPVPNRRQQLRKRTDTAMSHSHTGVFPSSANYNGTSQLSNNSIMTQSNYEIFNNNMEKHNTSWTTSRKYIVNNRKEFNRRPWR